MENWRKERTRAAGRKKIGAPGEERRKAVWDGMKIVRGRGMLRELRGKVVISPREVRGWDRWKDREVSGPGREGGPRLPDRPSDSENSFFSACLFLYPVAKLSSTVVRSNVTREGEFREEFSRKPKTKEFFVITANVDLLRVREGEDMRLEYFREYDLGSRFAEGIERRRFDE